MSKSKITVGWKRDFPKNLPCDRCQVKLSFSTRRDVQLAYSTSTRKFVGFMCVKCYTCPYCARSSIHFDVLANHALKRHKMYLEIEDND